MFDPISTYWFLAWASITSYGVYLLLTQDKQAAALYVYGKSLDAIKKKKQSTFWRLYLVPKRYFCHFYLFSLCLFIPSLVVVLINYSSCPANNKLQAIISSSKEFSKNLVKIEVVHDLNEVVALLFTVILMIIQCSRRLYECLFVSVYSNYSKINILHYIFGHSFYMFAAISTLSPILYSQTSDKFKIYDLVDNLLNKERAILFVLFIYTSHHQYKCHTIFAKLRKDKTGRVITEQHYVPTGGLFEYVSCPHFMLEIVLYFIIISMQHFQIYYWNMIFMLVLSTQTINAITEHRWYKTKYKDYPKERRAIVPKLL